MVQGRLVLFQSIPEKENFASAVTGKFLGEYFRVLQGLLSRMEPDSF
jgi:hypothetical protein